MTDEKKPQDGEATETGPLTAALPKSLLDAGKTPAPAPIPAAPVQLAGQAPAPGAATRTVRLIPDPAIHSRGQYQAGQTYTVPAAEAERLLASGHFEEVA